MSTQPSEKEIEDASISIITELIEARKGEKFTDITEVITFIAVICSNAATLESVDYKKMPIGEQVDIAAELLPNVYIQLHSAGLINLGLDLEIQALLKDMIKLKLQLQTAIAMYDLTAQIMGLPSAKDAKKSGLSALTSGLKKFKF